MLGFKDYIDKKDRFAGFVGSDKEEKKDRKEIFWLTVQKVKFYETI